MFGTIFKEKKMESIPLKTTFATSGVSVEIKKDSSNNFFIVLTGGGLPGEVALQATILEMSKLQQNLGSATRFIQSM